MADDYEVGYGKPPTKHQFRKGRSGNPRGRPKEAETLRGILQEVLASTVHVTENGKSRPVSALRAAAYALRQKALKGDKAALDKLFSLAAKFESESASAEPETDLSMLTDHEFAVYGLLAFKLHGATEKLAGLEAEYIEQYGALPWIPDADRID